MRISRWYKGKTKRIVMPMVSVMAAGLLWNVPVLAAEVPVEEEWEIPAPETAVTSGECGENGNNVTWSYDSEEKKLTISGTGKMKDYGVREEKPWGNELGNIESVVVEEGVTSIGDSAFNNCSSLSSVELPDSVTSIGDSAFWKCSSLSSIELPEGLTSIRDCAFMECSSLSSIKLPEGVTSIEIMTFAGCSSLGSIELPEGVTSIGMGAFSACSSLDSIELPKGVTSIKNGGFSQCSNLKSVKLPEGLTSIGDSAFMECSSLSSIELPESLTSIGMQAFDFCSSLNSIELPEGLTSIGDSAFIGCSSLSSIELPESLTSIGDYAFVKCSSLNGIELPEGLTSIGESVFSGCSSLSSIELPESLTSIGDSAFMECSSLSSIELPEGLTSIGERAFLGCGALSSIKLPNSVTSVGGDAFRMCRDLQTVITACSWKTVPLYSFSSEIEMKFRHMGNCSFTADEAQHKISMQCDACNGVENAVITAPVSRVYSGKPIEATVENTMIDLTPVVTYSGNNLVEGKPVNAGTYTASMTIGEKTVSLEYEIEKADGVTVEDLHRTYPYVGGIKESIALSQMFPADCGEADYGVPQIEGDIAYSVAPVVDGGILSYTVAAGEVDAQGTIKVDVATGNYEDFVVTVSVKLVNQKPVYVKEGTEVTLKKNTLAYGQTLSELEFNSAVFVDEEGKTVVGTLAWKNPQSIPGLEVQSATWIFTPENAEYATLEGNVAIVVSQITDAPGKPQTVMNVPFATRQVSEVPLPANWAWEAEDADKVLKPEEAVTVTAVYTGADGTYYKETIVEVTITRAGREWVFTDVIANPGNWKYEGIKYVYNNEIMNGIGGTALFRPDESLNRAMFATVLYRMAGSPQVTYEAVFPDVEEGRYYSEAIVWAKKQGMVTGYGDGTYGVNRNITREQIAKILYEYAAGCGYDVGGRASLAAFTDEDKVGGWAQDYICWAVHTGMIEGKPNEDGSYRIDPKGDATRAECAKMLRYFMEKYN